jgi:tetratricopeptide (TPR) repeat protein
MKRLSGRHRGKATAADLGGKAGVPGSSEPGAGSTASVRRRALLAGLLFVLVAGIFIPAVTHDFITYDDPAYVTENPHVAAGLTWDGARWAFRSTEASNWHPLTWLSHMADCQLFGLHPWGHHLTSVLLHAANAVLLFGLLQTMTGALWRSLFVAALFGIHPLHVESVAWVSERKDVLSTTLMFLALWAYARRFQRPRGASPGAMGFYGASLLCFALGLMAKPMLVTLPFVLLLLDYWPLRRWQGSSPGARWLLILEKLPFLAVSAASCAVTLWAQQKGGAVASVEDFPLPVRLANALTSYGWYLSKVLVPTKLAVFYPFFAARPPLWQITVSATVLAALTATSVALRRRQPYLLVGWLWYLGTLVPVIGLVQIGGQAMADRYSYVPLVGVFIMAAWAIPDAIAPLARRRWALGIAAGAALAACAVVASRQLAYWKNGVSLFHHALAVTTRNWVAHANLAATLSKTSTPEANAELQATLRILAEFAETYNKKGIELEQRPGHLPEAIRQFRTAVQILPVLAGPHFNLGIALAKTPGGMPEAINELRITTQLKPEYVAAHRNLATALANTRGAEAEAVAEYGTVLRMAPNDLQAHFFLGQVLARDPARTDEAVAQFEAVLAARPDFEPAREMIRRLQASSR